MKIGVSLRRGTGNARGGECSFAITQQADWSLIDVVFLWASVLALCVGLRQLSVLASWLIVPYLVWVSFAAILNLYIVRWNGPFGGKAWPG